MVTDPDLIRLFIEPLEELEIPYMITGGVASVIYGDPRFTRDIDVVLELRGAHIGRLASAFAAGDFYVPPKEVLEEEAARPQRRPPEAGVLPGLRLRPAPARCGDDAPDQRRLGGSARAREVDRRARPPRSYPESPTLRALTAS